jgi:hypothetical protein
MSLYKILIHSWAPEAVPDDPQVIPALEAGKVLFLPALSFRVEPRESELFTPAILGAAKNVSFDPARGRLGGTVAGKGLPGRPGSDEAAGVLVGLMRRFSASAGQLIDRLFPAYRGRARVARASFRPAEIAGRATSWRKDDTRLHVDSFPATPSGGQRILRLFTNVNPAGRSRSWCIGDEFEAVARRFAPRLRPPLAMTGDLLSLLRITRTPRTPYDALMLQLHDAMKADQDFQRSSPQERIDFPAGSTWIAFTDSVSHAATAGQYQLEQTFLLPVEAMLDQERSPLRILERLKQRRLA